MKTTAILFFTLGYASAISSKMQKSLKNLINNVAKDLAQVEQSDTTGDVASEFVLNKPSSTLAGVFRYVSHSDISVEELEDHLSWRQDLIYELIYEKLIPTTNAFFGDGKDLKAAFNFPDTRPTFADKHFFDGVTTESIMTYSEAQSADLYYEVTRDLIQNFNYVQYARAMYQVCYEQGG